MSARIPSDNRIYGPRGGGGGVPEYLFKTHLLVYCLRSFRSILSEANSFMDMTLDFHPWNIKFIKVFVDKRVYLLYN